MSRRIRAALGGLAVVAAASALASALVLLPATAASAHDYLLSSSPAAGSTVTEAPGSVSLTFNDLVLDLGGEGPSALLEVTGPDAQTTHFESGCASILGRTVSAPVALGAAGVYTVSWQIVSADGHQVSKSLTFTYAPPAGVAESAGTATARDCGQVQSGTGSTGSVGSASTSADESAAGWAILAVAGGVVLLAVIGVVVVLLFSRRRKDPEKSSEESNPGS